MAISGTLLLEKGKEVRIFYKKSLLPLIVTTEFWIVINYVFVCIVQGNEFIFLNLIQEMLFMRELELSHMWYMPMILGMYVMIPFLSKLMEVYQDGKAFLLPGILVGISSILLPTVNVFMKEAIPGGRDIAFKMDLSFGGGVYGLYLILGYQIGRKGLLEKVRTTSLVIISAGFFVLNTVGQYYLYTNSYFESNRLLWYTSVAIFVMGLSSFELIRRYHNQIGKVMRGNIVFWAKCSFGIYLLHKPIMVLVLKYVPMERINVMLRIICLLFFSIGISSGILYLFYRKWKRAGRWIFLIK